MRTTEAMVVNSVRDRVLVLDLRSGKCGFAVFEGPHDLLDFGTRSYARKYGSAKAASRRQFARLLTLHRPSLIVFRSAITGSNTTRTRMELIVMTLRRLARSHRVRARLLSRQKVKSFFEAQVLATKYAVALHLAEQFLELTGKLTRKGRKPWESEHPQMPVFDAVATAMVHFQCPAIGRK